MPPATPENSEWLARKQLIDPQLVACGWKIVSWTKAQPGPLAAWSGYAIEEYPTRAGPGDYALCVDGEIVGIVEAKKLTVGPRGALVQAERYAKGLEDGAFNFRGYRVPFLYATNGEVRYFHDLRHELSTSRRIAKFHSPDALHELLGRDLAAAYQWFAEHPNENPKLRPYQQEANAATENAVSDQKRQMLVAMATGTGKTFTLVNQSYRLLKSGAARRILFLVDRRALAAQAVRAFAAFEPEPNQKFDKLYEVYSNRFQREDFGEEDNFDSKVMPQDYLLKPQAKHSFVYVCTIQRMAINLLGRSAAFGEEGDDIDEDADVLPIPIHAFDLIIADECHRGYTTGHILRVRLNTDFILPEIVVFALHGDPSVRHQVSGNIRGITRPGFNTSLLESIAVPVAPLPEQQEIVRRVEKLFAFADEIEARLTEAQTHIDRLRQSILAKAFRGELVPTEHALAEREGRGYETAEQLLSRIHHEKTGPITSGNGKAHATAGRRSKARP